MILLGLVEFLNDVILYCHIAIDEIQLGLVEFLNDVIFNRIFRVLYVPLGLVEFLNDVILPITAPLLSGLDGWGL